MTHALVLVKKAGFKVTYGILGSSPEEGDKRILRSVPGDDSLLQKAKMNQRPQNADFALNSGSRVTCGKGFVVCI